MGIHKLMDLLKEKAPDCIKKLDLSFFSGRSVACDASMVKKKIII
jgi:flap endonuclease-1